MLTDQESRTLIIDLLTAQTERDKQVKVGASNLSNGCDFCLASNLTGDMRSTPVLDRAWGGRTIGTAIHSVLEERTSAEWFKRRFPDALVEYRMNLGDLGSYGSVGSTADLVLPSERQAFDHKGTTLFKLAVIRESMIRDGQDMPSLFINKARGGYDFKPDSKTVIHLSETELDAEITKTRYKLLGYYSQTCLYGMGLANEGIPIDRLTLNFISRDGTMWWDNPSQEGYTNPTKSQGVFSLGFNYSAEHADAMWNRALFMWENLEAGAIPEDFSRHQLCFACSIDSRESDEALPKIPATVTLGGESI